MAAYAWIITWADPELFTDETGINGPHDSPDAAAKILVKAQQTGAKPVEAQSFRMYDDDGNLYYKGWYIGPDDEDMFGPLQDFGTPNAGCTYLKYRNPDTGAWETL